MKKQKQFIDLVDERYGMFMSEESFNLDVELGRQFLYTDNVQLITLYRINIIESQTHSLYGQSKPSDRKYFEPVKLYAMVSVADSTQIGYGDGGITRDDIAGIEVGIYLKELEENNVEINRGDIISYNMGGEKERYYEVEYANNVIDETSKTFGGFKPYWRKVKAVPVKEDTIPFINETKK